MVAYQFCSLDSGGTKITHHRRNCADDVEARAAVHWIIPTGGMSEIWADERHVGTVWMPFITQAAPACAEVVQ